MEQWHKQTMGDSRVRGFSDLAGHSIWMLYTNKGPKSLALVSKNLVCGIYARLSGNPDSALDCIGLWNRGAALLEPSASTEDVDDPIEEFSDEEDFDQVFGDGSDLADLDV